MAVVIVDKPELGIAEDNLILHEGLGKPCKHLKGDKPGLYSCALHDYEWYKETPCFAFSQIEQKNTYCRLGAHFLKK